jgi:hypothetical protein
MFGFSKIKYNFSDLEQLRLEGSRLKEKIYRVWKGQARLPCSHVHHMHQCVGRDRCAQMVHAASFSNVLVLFVVAFKALYNDPFNYPTCVLFLFSLISSPKKTCKPVIIERYHVILFCTRVGPYSFDFYLLYLDFFFNFIPQYLVSFNFYIKFNPCYYDC